MEICPKTVSCKACSAKTLKYIYSMRNYSILRCDNCGTGVANPFPLEKTIESLYHGFLPAQKFDQIETKAPIAKTFFEMVRGGEDLCRQNFLDLGGGNGLFSYAFERFSFGTSTYIDRDPKSCAFVKKELKIKKVLTGDVREVSKIVGDNRYDIIYSRHMIEHLKDPFSVIHQCVQLLRPRGVAIFQCPNGDSLEYLSYLNSNLWDRFKTIRQSTNCSKTWLLWCFLSGSLMHGIDPPRHLWAITKKGLEMWGRRNGHNVEIFTTNLGDQPFSPWFAKSNSFKLCIENFVGQKILAPLRGGTHLIAKFKQN